MHDLKTSTLIRKGLKHLWDGLDMSDVESEEKEEYLCHAITRAARGGHHEWMNGIHRGTPETERRLQDVRDVIEKRLFPWNNMFSWLHYYANVPSSLLTSRSVQDHRRAWALKMIAEFKRKGD